MRKHKQKPDYLKQYADKVAVDLNRVSTYRKIKNFVGEAEDVLDIGCGTGYLLSFLGGGTGVDLDPKLIDYCKSCYSGSQFLVSDCYSIPLPDATFDAVTMCMIVEHLADPEKALVEARRLLKPGGSIVVVVPQVDNWFYHYLVKKDPTHVREYTAKEIWDLMSRLFYVKEIAFGTVSTKIPSFLTNYIHADSIVHGIKS